MIKDLQWCSQKLCVGGRPERRRCEARGAEGAEWGGVWDGCPLPSRLSGREERRELHQWGPGQSSDCKRIFCIF